MPEGPEIDTEQLHETIREKLEREGGRLLKAIALTTALLAALAALASLQAGATVNHALVRKTEAGLLSSKGDQGRRAGGVPDRVARAWERAARHL
jgi:hypothetical protein